MTFRSDYDFRTFFKLLHYCSINLNRCIKTCEYFILTFILTIYSLALKICPRGGDFEGKISGPGVIQGGGMVTGQTDTCITLATLIFLRNLFLLGRDKTKFSFE